MSDLSNNTSIKWWKWNHRQRCAAFSRRESCLKGDGCFFIHSTDTSTGIKPLPCNNRQLSSCHRGNSCRFSHEDDNLVCYAYMRGECERGERCRFAHTGSQSLCHIGNESPNSFSSSDTLDFDFF